MEQLTAWAIAHPYGAMAFYAVASALLSLLLANRSQLDSWAEANPRFAGALKLLRALGLDPWMLIQSLSLIVRGKLPAKPIAKAKDSPPSTARGFVKLDALIVGTLLGMTPLPAIVPGCERAREAKLPSDDPCSLENPAALAEALACHERAVKACGDPVPEECPVLKECDAAIEERCSR